MPKEPATPLPRKSCFVLMPFAKEFDLVWHYGIRAPFQDGGPLEDGWECTRADEWGPGQIMDQVYEEIRGCHAVLADLTGANPNVYYELGYAHALKRGTMLITQDPREALPFDVSGYRVLCYEATTEGLEKLKGQIVTWLSADLWSREGTPRFSLEPRAVVTADGVPFTLKNTGDGVAFNVEVTWNKWVVMYHQPVAPGQVSSLLIPHAWDFGELLEAGQRLPGPLQVHYRTPDGKRRTQNWDVKPVRTEKGMWTTEVREPPTLQLRPKE